MSYDLNNEEYAQQKAESESMRGNAKWQKMLQDFTEMEDDHPYTSTRIKELFLRGRSGLG